MVRSVQAGPDLIGRARYARYLADCGGDTAVVGDLIDWNVEMSGAVYEALHLLEVLLRNAMDRELRIWNDAQGHGTDWLITPDPRLRKLLKADALTQARNRARTTAKRDGRAVLNDDVLAQMTFGTWRYLLPSNSSVAKQRLWSDCLVNAFPEWPGPWDALVRRVEAIHLLRNRVAHLESLHRQNLRPLRQHMKAVASSTGWAQGRLFAERERMLPSIERLEQLRPD